MADRPFALVGVNINCYEPKQLKALMAREQLNWRSFADTADGEGLGAISSAWNLMGTPALFLLDHQGVIRHRWVGNPGVKTIDEALEKLVKEAERSGEPPPK